MGGTCSSPEEDDFVDEALKNKYVNLKHLKWKAEQPMTRWELKAKRDEFWDTRVEGRPEMWQALRLAAEENDAAQSLAIIESAGLSPYMQLSKTLCCSYDELGTRYDVPLYCLVPPTNLLTGEVHDSDDEGEGAGDASGAKAKAAAGPGGDGQPKPKKKAPSDGNIGVKVRLMAPLNKDIEFKVNVGDTVLSLKNQLASADSIAVPRQRFFFCGKELRDEQSLAQVGLKDGYIVQVIVRPE